MFQTKIENPLNQSAEPLQSEPSDFKMIQLKFKKSFYGIFGYDTDRTKMQINELDIENKNWMTTNLKMDNGLLEFTIPKTGKYEIVQESRTSNYFLGPSVTGPAMGVHVTIEMNLKKVIIFYLKLK